MDGSTDSHARPRAHVSRPADAGTSSEAHPYAVSPGFPYLQHQTAAAPVAFVLTSYSQAVAQQYHRSYAGPQAQTLAPSSHLPSQYHATPAHVEPQQFVDHAHGSSSSSSTTSSTCREPLQRVLMWQNGLSDASPQPSQQAGPQESYRLLSPHGADALPPAAEDWRTGFSGSSSTGPGTGAAAAPRATVSSFPSGPPTDTPAPLSNAAQHFKDFLPPLPEPGPHPQTIHFHPPAPATPNISLSQPIVASQSAPTPPIPRTIDLNPGLAAARQASLDVGSAAQRTSSFPPLSLVQQQQHQQNYDGPSQSHLGISGTSSTSGIYKPMRAGDWDSGTPPRNAHARFQSASNIRGAPTEAGDGTPGSKFMWEAHGRMATMESIASSQWSPIVNDMYQLVDPLRPNFDFNAMIENPPASPTRSAVPVVQQTRPSQLDRRLSSFSSAASGALPAPPHSSFRQSIAAPSHDPASQSLTLPQHSYQTLSGFQPVMNNLDTTQLNSRQSRLQLSHQQMQTHHLQAMGSAPNPTLQEEDPENRRASTSTSISSAPLLSPQEFQNDHLPIAGQTAGPQAAIHLGGQLSNYSHESPNNPYVYREYFYDPYDPSPPIQPHALPYVPYDGEKQASLTSCAPFSAITQHGQQDQMSFQSQATWNAPVAELERHTLREVTPQGSDNMGTEEFSKRKRSTSRQRPELKQSQPPSNIARQTSQEASESLKPAEDRTYRRLSSPVLSMRPNDGGEGAALSDEDDEEEGGDNDNDEFAEKTSTDRSQPGIMGTQYGSYTHSNFNPTTAWASPSESASVLPNAPIPMASVFASSTFDDSGHRTTSDNYPLHSAPPPPDTSHLVRVLPNDVDEGGLGRPRRQKVRFEGDWYTPEWVRGDSSRKEGFCDLCIPGKWLQLKNSAFWYHRQYTHGISSVSGHPFSNPVTFRQADSGSSTEALCHQCNEWVMYTSKKQNAAEDPSHRIPTNWFKHAHRCHFNVGNRNKNEKPRGKRRKVTSSPEG